LRLGDVENSWQNDAVTAIKVTRSLTFYNKLIKLFCMDIFE